MHLCCLICLRLPCLVELTLFYCHCCHFISSAPRCRCDCHSDWAMNCWCGFSVVPFSFVSIGLLDSAPKWWCGSLSCFASLVVHDIIGFASQLLMSFSHRFLVYLQYITELDSAPNSWCVSLIGFAPFAVHHRIRFGPNCWCPSLIAFFTIVGHIQHMGVFDSALSRSYVCLIWIQLLPVWLQIASVYQMFMPNLISAPERVFDVCRKTLCACRHCVSMTCPWLRACEALVSVQPVHDLTPAPSTTNPKPVKH